MGGYGIVASAIIALILIGVARHLFRLRKDRGGSEATQLFNRQSRWRRPAGTFVEHVIELPPHGRLLVLTAPERPGPDAIWEKLSGYCDGGMPYVGIIVDCGDQAYRFSSADLGGVASAIAAWARGWVAPCAVVANGSGSKDLQHLLQITTLAQIEELRIVDSLESALTHVELHLKRRAIQPSTAATNGAALP